MRLKPCYPNLLYLHIQHFNSTVVRLKLESVENGAQLLMNFNSTVVRLKPTGLELPDSEKSYFNSTVVRLKQSC